MAPDLMSSRTLMLSGKKRIQTASMKKTPFSRAASTSFRVCAAVTVRAFSQSTFLPAWMASMAFWKWWLCGVAT